jgi:hypothetical protein
MCKPPYWIHAHRSQSRWPTGYWIGQIAKEQQIVISNRGFAVRRAR